MVKNQKPLNMNSIIKYEFFKLIKLLCEEWTNINQNYYVDKIEKNLSMLFEEINKKKQENKNNIIVEYYKKMWIDNNEKFNNYYLIFMWNKW
jgi:hypothetical protein